MKKLNLVFKKRSSWKKYQSKATIQTRNEYLDFLIDPIFHGLNKQYFLPTLEIKDYNVMMMDKTCKKWSACKNCLKNISQHSENLRQVKKMITQPVVY